MLNDYNKNILEFAQKWRTGTISDQEMNMLNDWFYALEGVALSCPDEDTVENLEKRLHQQLWKPLWK